MARHNVGEIKFLGCTDVRHLNLDDIVEINMSEVSFVENIISVKMKHMQIIS